MLMVSVSALNFVFNLCTYWLFLNVEKIHLLEGKQENVPPRSVKDRLGIPNNVQPHTNKVLNLVQPKAENNTEENASAGENNKNAETRKEETKAQQAMAIKKGQELLAAKEKLKKNQEEKRKEAMKLTQDLRKRKQELLEKQLAQQKLLIDKLEKSKFFQFF